MKRMFLVPVLAAASLALAAPACAQSRGRIDSSRPSYSDGERQSYNDARREAYDNGYREGLKLGERDGRRGDAFAYQNEREYQRANKGYRRGYGDVDRYRQAFRSGYATGYRDGYERFRRGAWGNNGNGRGRGPVWSRNGGYGQYPRGGGYYSPAYENGANDGYEKGVEDARKRRSFDVLRHKWYREGDRHYEGRYGSREQYKDVYRQGFREGYERGFREGRYR